MLGALFGFKGRLSRPGFWEVLLSIVLIDVLLVVGRMYVADSGLPGGYGPSSSLCQALLAAAPWVIGIFTVWSLLAAVIKRCHDRGRTGALVLLVLIPVIGWLWLLIDLFVLAGSRGKNRYGAAPHAPPGEGGAQSGFNWGAEPAAAAAAAAAIGHEEPAHGGHPDHSHGHHDDHAAADAHGHDAHHEHHGGHDHGHGGHHDEPAHADHGHGAHGHEAHGHDDHGHDDHSHGHDGHEHAAHGHDDHGHGGDHGHGHGHDDHNGHDAHHGDGHDEHHGDAGHHHGAPAHAH